MNVMAEDYKHIDQIIRQKFENFEPEPPLQVWENIKSNIPKDPGKPSSPGILLPIIVTVSLIIFIAGLFNHYYTKNENVAADPENRYSSVQTAGVLQAGTSSNAELPSDEPAYQIPSQIPVTGENTVTTSEPKVAKDIPVRVPFTQKTSKDVKKTGAKLSGDTKTTRDATPGKWRSGLAEKISSGNTLSYSDAMKYDLSPRDVRKLSSLSEKKQHIRPDWAIGAYFNPEVTSYSDDVENSMGYNIAVMPRVTFNHFFLQSGINARFANDKGNVSVNYNRYLGSYQDVYDVTFDSTESGIIPTYYTHTVDVYDTVDHYAYQDTKARYTYLEVPLYFGYTYSFGRLTLHAIAGPAASFLVSRNIPDAGSPEENAKVINVNYQIPVRSTVNWQLMMGAGFDYNLGDKFSFTLEPTFRYALKADYTLPENNNGKTMSFGLRAGLNYKF